MTTSGGDAPVSWGSRTHPPPYEAVSSGGTSQQFSSPLARGLKSWGMLMALVLMRDRGAHSGRGCSSSMGAHRGPRANFWASRRAPGRPDYPSSRSPHSSPGGGRALQAGTAISVTGERVARLPFVGISFRGMKAIGGLYGRGGGRGEPTAAVPPRDPAGIKNITIHQMLLSTIWTLRLPCHILTKGGPGIEQVRP